MIWDCFELCEVVKKQHEIIFEKANLVNQCRSYAEEYDELVQSTAENQLPYYADCFIAACGIARFNFQVGYSLCLEQWLEISVAKHQEFAEEVIKKMRINAKREWLFNDITGYFREKAICVNCGKSFDKKQERSKTCCTKCQRSYERKKYESSEKGKIAKHKYYLKKKIKDYMEEENENNKKQG